VKGKRAVLERFRDNRDSQHGGRLEKRQAILAALTKATTDSQSLAGNHSDAEDESSEYYSLTHEEIIALINGDMEKIESWVSNLDQRQATWLLRCLIKEQG
jgi:hypothetical protein